MPGNRVTVPAMSQNDPNTAEDDVEVVPMELPLSRRTIAWLARLHRATGDRPADIVASMLHDIMADDESVAASPSSKQSSRPLH